jgi:hypothetical protein
MTARDSTPTDPTESLTDPAAFRDADDVDYDEIEDDSHFEMNRELAGVAAVGVTDSNGRLALVEFEAGTALTHGMVEPGEDFAENAREGAHELLGIEVTLDALVAVRKKTSTDPDSGEEVVAHDAIFAASPADSETLPADVPSCQVEATGWYETLPDGLSGIMREDAELFIE